MRTCFGTKRETLHDWDRGSTKVTKKTPEQSEHFLTGFITDDFDVVHYPCLEQDRGLERRREGGKQKMLRWRVRYTFGRILKNEWTSVV